MINKKIDGVYGIVGKLYRSTVKLLNEFSMILSKKDLVDCATQTEIRKNAGSSKVDAINTTVGQSTHTFSVY